MKQLHIPSLGDTVTLAKNWHFTLKNEARNRKLFAWLGYTVNNSYHAPLHTLKSETYKVHCNLGPGRIWHDEIRTCQVVDKKGPDQVTASLPKGITLIIDRIYIRAGNEDFNSVTFKTYLPGDKRVIRFFASLDEVNSMFIV